VLELNPDHPLVDKLKVEQEQESFDDLALVLFEQALLSEGAVLEDPADFVRRINKLMLD
jgi:molecular chaperone HtpG